MHLNKIFFALFLLLCVSRPVKAQDTTQRVISSRFNSTEQQQKPYVILISVDGLRWDFADKYQAKNLIRLRNAGVEAAYLKPSFPSLTFPNHYSMVTGLYPAHHGIVDNTFYDKRKGVLYKKSNPAMAVDSSWYGGKPLWALAEQQQLLSAVFYWPGSEVKMQESPTYFYPYNEIIPIDNRVATVKKWLELPANKRPHFIALYFPQVDKAAHSYGVNSEQTRAAVTLVDNAIGKIVDAAAATGQEVNFIIVSDHGMTNVDNENTLPLPDVINREDFIIPPGSSMLQLYAKNKASIKPTYKALKAIAKDYEVYLQKNIPKVWHYNTKEDLHHRIGDILLIPHLPKVFSINGIKPAIGQHGFDPAFEDMHASFYAWGPAFKSGIKIGAFENVSIYPLVAKILGLNYSQEIDGKLNGLNNILKQPDEAGKK